MSDEAGTYRYLYDFGYFNHHSVNHSEKEYGRGLVHNNTIEGVWSQLKEELLEFIDMFQKSIYRIMLTNMPLDITTEI